MKVEEQIKQTANEYCIEIMREQHSFLRSTFNIQNSDDVEKWGFLDWVILIFSPVIAPFILGRMIGKVVYEISKLENDEGT